MAYRATRHLTILNAERLVESLGRPHTICVTGQPRGGTSAVALLLRELGLFMGEEIDPRNHEDLPLQRARGDPAAFAAIARRYDAAHEAWGFKLPVGSRMGRALLPRLRNPVQIVVARNPVAVIRSRLARGERDAPDAQARFLEMLAALHADGERLARETNAGAGPLIFVEYERLLGDGEAFVRELAEALGLPTEGPLFERAARAVSEAGYRRYSGDPDTRPLETARVAKGLFRE